MPFRARSLTIAPLGDTQDALPDAPQPSVADGVHLHRELARTPGLPGYGYHLFRRNHRAGTPRRLSEYVGVLTPGPWSGSSLATSLGSVISDRPLLLTKDFPASDAVELDLRDRAWLRFVLPPGASARRMECRIGFRARTDCPPKVCIDFTGRVPGSGSNPRREEDPITHEAVMFLAHDRDCAPQPNTHIQSIQLGGSRYTGLSCEGDLKITLPSASSYVEAMVSGSVSPVVLEAYNEDGSLAGRTTSADPTGKAEHGPELLRIDGHSITRVVVQDRNGKSLLHRLCCQPIPVTTIRVTALAGRTPVAQTLACGRPGQIAVVAVEFDGMDAIELAPEPAALLDVGVVAFNDEATVGCPPVPGFPAPLRLPLTHSGYPCVPGMPENREQTLALEPQAFEQPSITHEDEPPPATIGRLRQIQVYIDTHLADPDLSPKRIAAANRISLRYLYKLFLHANCAVNEWIRERRLARCAEALVSPAQANRNIAEVAYAWGFNDLSHFNRMFKRRFGVSPRGYRRIADTEGLLPECGTPAAHSAPISRLPTQRHNQ